MIGFLYVTGVRWSGCVCMGLYGMSDVFLALLVDRSRVRDGRVSGRYRRVSCRC